MNTCKHCLDTIYTGYDTCMTCYEKQNPPKNIMEKTIEDYQKEINALQATVNGDGFNIKRLSEENEKLRSELQIKEFYEYYSGFGAKKDLTTTQMLNHLLQTVPNYKPTKEEYDLEDMKRHCNHYIEALTEITKKNRKAETCRLIALKALGRLNDYYQPELLVEENLKLKMKVEDLESQIANIVLEKVFNPENVPLKDWEGNPITHCDDCGEFWGYHHEEHCTAKLLDNADKHSKMYPW